MTLKIEDVLRAIAEEKAAWNRMVNNIPLKRGEDRAHNQTRRDAVNQALLNLIDRVLEITEREA